MMLRRLEDSTIQAIKTLLFNLSLVGFGLIFGVALFRAIREALIWDQLASMGFSGYCDVLCNTMPGTFLDNLYNFNVTVFWILMCILIVKLILMICYSKLMGEKKRIMYSENFFSLVIVIVNGIFSFQLPGCICLY